MVLVYHGINIVSLLPDRYCMQTTKFSLKIYKISCKQKWILACSAIAFYSVLSPQTHPHRPMPIRKYSSSHLYLGLPLIFAIELRNALFDLPLALHNPAIRIFDFLYILEHLQLRYLSSLYPTFISYLSKDSS